MTSSRTWNYGFIKANAEHNKPFTVSHWYPHQTCITRGYITRSERHPRLSKLKSYEWDVFKFRREFRRARQATQHRIYRGRRIIFLRKHLDYLSFQRFQCQLFNTLTWQDTLFCRLTCTVSEWGRSELPAKFYLLFLFMSSLLETPRAKVDEDMPLTG